MTLASLCALQLCFKAATLLQGSRVGWPALCSKYNQHGVHRPKCMYASTLLQLSTYVSTITIQ